MERDVVPFIVNGQPVRTGRSFPVINPATEERIAEVANADRASVEAALAAARDAFPGWAATPIAERRAIMDRCCAVLEREKERLEKNSRARMRKAEAPYVKFSNAVEKALAEAEMRDVMIIGKAASEQWQAAAWRLERKFPQRWGRRVAIEDAKKRDSAKGAITELMQRLREEAGDDDSEADR